MATFKISVLKHQRRKDGLYPVSIRVYWKSQYAYIKTQYYVNDKKLKKTYEEDKKTIKSVTLNDNFIISELAAKIRKYEEIKATKLGESIFNLSAKELAIYFETQSNPKTHETPDLFEFSEDLIHNTKNKGTADTIRYCIVQVKNFCKLQRLPFSYINYKFLQDFERYLIDSGVKNGANNYMRRFRTIILAARDQFNDEETGEIKVLNPFKKYKIPKPSPPEKRALTIEQVKIIRDFDKLEFPREKQSRDIFMMSFYALGMNTVDFYNVEYYKAGRISYNRTKEMTRREDQAYISIKAEPELLPYIEKYKDPQKKKVFCFSNEYSNFKAFNKSVNMGLKKLAQKVNEEYQKKVLPENLTFYAARHSFATIARNDCGISKSDIDEALNHVDPNARMADKYLKKDWSIIDKVSRKVLDALR